ncbi:MAG: aminotransferase class V-fold PLP-dependent enzyme [Chloroflexi bacterium]|nr:aminotransferase class V-fold PLP-dependent enzyme [Chloroflexota bacterium]
MIDVDAIRAQIPVTQRAVYLNTGWSGPSPRTVIEAIKAHLELEAEDGPASPSSLKVHREVDSAARAEVARLVGATPEEISLTENTTEGINIVLNGLSWQPGDEAITFGIEHSSVLIPTLFLEREGVLTKVLDVAPEDSADAILAKLHGALTPRTKLVSLSHVEYATGMRMPLAEICAMVQPRGVQVIVDGAQAIGQIAVDFRALPVDYYAMPGQKWLLGPDGTGALFVRANRIADLQPRKVSGAAGRYDRESRTFEQKPELIRKFELTTSSTALRAGFIEAIRFHQQAGTSEIEHRNSGLASLLKDSLLETTGITVITPLDPVSTTGLVTFRIDGITSQESVERLWDHWRIAARSINELEATRVSLHFFNTEAEVETLVGAVRELASGAA